jgi:leucyl aminopeptidase
VVATLDASDTEMAGQGVVVVSAHLDSIAEEGDDATDPAPGADDDGSGMAAVLAAAHAFAELASLRPHREVRFALFNAEEVGRTGSKTYADAHAALGTRVAAVFHIDMIGYDGRPPACFEVHAGFVSRQPGNISDAAVQSVELANLLEHLRPVVTTLTAAQISTHDDLGAGRSDHSMFHAAGYPACWVTQDFFPDDPAVNDRNPDYHSVRDTNIVEEYAAQIARLVAAAAWIAATR